MNSIGPTDTPRKIIQITGASSKKENAIFALCEDGTLWHGYMEQYYIPHLDTFGSPSWVWKPIPLVQE